MSFHKPLRAEPVKLGAIYLAREAAERRAKRRFALLLTLGPVAMFGLVWYATPTLMHAEVASPVGADAPGMEQGSVPARAAVYYPGCNAVRAAGLAPLYRGDPGYRPEMDGDNDGIACEPRPPNGVMF